MRLSAKHLLMNALGGAVLGASFAVFLLLYDAFGLGHLLLGDRDAEFLVPMFAAQWALIVGVSVGATAVLAPPGEEE